MIHYAFVRYTEEFGREDYGYPFLKLYHGYTMKHPAIASNYQKAISSFRGSGLLTNCKPDYFIFVDLYKDENIREEINYKDKFLTRKEFQWQSPNDSIKERGSGYEIIHNIERHNNLHLFVRKYSEIEKIPQPYIYLGKVDTHPESAEGEKPITMIFALENELPQDLFEDFMTNEKFVEIEDNE
jgi:glutaredoxin-related protein